jgi:hypothetical protein
MTAMPMQTAPAIKKRVALRRAGSVSSNARMTAVRKQIAAPTAETAISPRVLSNPLPCAIMGKKCKTIQAVDDSGYNKSEDHSSDEPKGEDSAGNPTDPLAAKIANTRRDADNPERTRKQGGSVSLS